MLKAGWWFHQSGWSSFGTTDFPPFSIFQCKSARKVFLTSTEPHAEGAVKKCLSLQGTFFSFLLFFFFWKNLSNKTRISVKITRKNIHKYMFTIYFVHLHELFKKSTQGCLLKSIHKESAVITLHNVNMRHWFCCYWRRPQLPTAQFQSQKHIFLCQQEGRKYETHLADTALLVRSPATTQCLQNVHKCRQHVELWEIVLQLIKNSLHCIAMC